MTAVPTERRIRGRYAPSPTGPLHLGNLRTALLAWLCARSAGGAFILRVEDLDAPRVRARETSGMLRDLGWLGLDWDEGPNAGGLYGPYAQSQRSDLYSAALAALREHDLVYPCYCTRAELATIASAPHLGDAAPTYPGTCRTLSQRQRRAREATGRRPSLRFKAPNAPISFVDALAGRVEEHVAATTGDFIVRRSDGVTAYQLAVVVDDALMGVSQVVRGSDLLESTARQLALYDALGYERPGEFAHVPIALDADGKRMAKRDRSEGIASLEAQGWRPEELLGALAASCGFWPTRTPATLAELLAAFDISRVSSEPSAVEL